MAAAEPVKAIKAEVTCSICLALFRDPVTTECGHSFCEPCIARHCEGRAFDVACPLCKRTFRRESLRPNRELRNIVDSINQPSALQGEEEPGGVAKCEKHQEPLKLYCKSDRSPLCVICRESQAHRGHKVVPVEEAVQQFRETMRKQLERIESGYKTLHQLLTTGCTYLPQSEREEEHQRLKRLTDNVATLFKVHTEGPRQRFADAASQTQPCDPEARGSSPRKDADETESQEHKGREPGSEPAAEKQEETRSHVGHVCEEAPTPKYGLDQTSLDPRIHTISSTTEAAEREAFQRRHSQIFAAIVYKMLGSSSESDSSESDDSEETERQGHSGREPGREPAAEKQETTGGLVGKETPTCKNELSQGSLDTVIHKIRGTRGDAEPKVDAQQTENRSEDPGSQMEPEQSLSRSELPAREVSKETERQGHSVEVTLDPATAHPLLVLSEDRKSARRGDTKQDLPDNPERFDTCISVLGSEGFTSGRRYWEVEVGPREGWAIGVARDSVQRKGGIQLKPHMGIWALIPSEKSQVPRKVGVYLDYEGGEMRFYNAETMALISSHTATFTGRLVPFFSLWAVGSRISLSPSQR